MHETKCIVILTVGKGGSLLQETTNFGLTGGLHSACSDQHTTGFPAEVSQGFSQMIKETGG